jgi:hypothetical protein
MKRNINLFSQDEIKQKLTKIMEVMMTWNIILFIIFIIVLLGVSGFLIYQTGINTTNERSLDNLKVFIQQNQGFDRKLSYFIYKADLLKQYLKDDSKGFTYHERLNSILSTNAPNGLLSGFQIDNKRDVSFSVKFSSYEDTIQFIKFVESPDFLKEFEYVKINPLTVNGKTPSSITGTPNPDEPEPTPVADELSVDFQGKFKEIK